MDGQIRITADGAGKVGVVRQHQAVVAQGLRGVTAFCMLRRMPVCTGVWMG